MSVSNLKDAARKISELEAKIQGLEKENAKLKTASKKKPATKESADN